MYNSLEFIVGDPQAGQTVDDNATIDPFSAMTITDPDKNATLAVTVSLDDPNKGHLTNLGGFLEGPSGTYIFVGSPAESTSAIQGLIFDPTEGRVPVGEKETTTFTISADDGNAAPVTDDTTTVIVTVINDPPTISGTVAGQTVDDIDTIDPFTAVTISDPDTVAITVTITLDDPAKGNLIILGGFVESPDGTYNFVGSPMEATTAIQGLTFDPIEGRVPVGDTETTTFTISADDGIAAPVTDDTTTVIVTAVEEPNTPPSISGTLAGQTVDDNATIDPFTTVTISDPDTVAITVTVTLDDPDKGDLINLGGFVEGPDGTYTFAGSSAESTTSIRGLTFDPIEDCVLIGQNETTTFTISADDGIADQVADDTTTVIVTVVDKVKKLFLPLIIR